MIFSPDSEFMKIADRSTRNWQRMRSHARAGSNLGLNIKKPDTENGKVIIFNGIDGVRKVARMLVPIMVKNGFNSVLQTSAGSRRLVAARNSGTNAKSKTVPKS